MELEKMKLASASGSELHLEALYQIMPSAFTEVRDEKTGEITHKINFSTLRELLGDNAYDEADEEYGFKWVGKNAARREAARSINKTLRPCPEESVDWENTQNLYIEGDNLEVLKLLQKSYLGKIKMIYIDPPYNTGNDFVYRDDFAMDKDGYDRAAGDVDELGNRFRKNADGNARFHSDWCSMIYERLLIARSLLANDGVIFISIDDNEVRNMQNICDEIFGQEMQIACFPRITKKAGKTTDAIAKNHDYIIAYSKTQSPLFYLPYHTDEGFKNEDEYVAERGLYKLNQTLDYDSLSYSSSLDYPITIEGQTLYPGSSYEAYLERKNGNHARADWAWRWSKEMFDFGYNNGFIVLKKTSNGYRIYTKTYQNAKIEKVGNDFRVVTFDRTKAISSLEFIENDYSNDNSKKNLLKLFDKSVFDYSKPVSLLYKLAQYTSTSDDIILDFFSGSATTAHAVMQLNAEDGGNRRYIMVQLPEETEAGSEAYKAGYKNICEIGKERIRRAGRKIKEEAGEKAATLDTGFRVFKCEDSFMNDVYFSPAELQQQDLFAQVSNIKDGTSDLSMLFGCMLDWGVQLSLPLSTFEVAGKTIYNVNDGDLVACFNENVNEDAISAIAELNPLRVVFRDSCFGDAPLKMNLFELFKQKCSWSEEVVRSRVHVI